MFKGYNNRQPNGFPNLNFFGDISAYGYGGVSFWLDAAFGLNTQTDLGAVSRWMPRIGASAYTQDTAGNQPRLVLNDTNFNNLPSIQNIDNNRFMSNPLGNGLNFNPTGTTIVCVYKMDSISQNSTILGDSSTRNVEPFSLIQAGGSGAGFNGLGLYNNGSIRLQGTTEATTPRIGIITNGFVMQNGTVETSANFSAGISSITFSTLFTYSSSRFCLVGRLSEIIAYNFTMTQEQAVNVSNSLNSKYVIY